MKEINKFFVFQYPEGKLFYCIVFFLIIIMIHIILLFNNLIFIKIIKILDYSLSFQKVRQSQ